jgi:SAM-dependent methyltransferase
VQQEDLKDKRVLEIGLGYGTLGNYIAQQESEYYGIDIAWAPAKMMQYRLGLLGSERSSGGSQGSVLALPFADNHFDYVYSIGCLHHTGNLQLAVKEVHRVLRTGGKAIIMLYNQESFRQKVQISWIRLRDRLIFKKEREEVETYVRSLYDAASTGEAAPYTEYLSRAQVRQLFSLFSHIEVDIQNFDDYAFVGGRIRLQRKWFLSNLARVLGLDLYIKAVK